MSVFGNVWVYSAVAFVIGVLLTWLSWVLPLQRRLRRARTEAMAASPGPEAVEPQSMLFAPGEAEDERSALVTGTAAPVSDEVFDEPYAPHFQASGDELPMRGEQTALVSPFPGGFAGDDEPYPYDDRGYDDHSGDEGAGDQAEDYAEPEPEFAPFDEYREYDDADYPDENGYPEEDAEPAEPEQEPSMDGNAAAYFAELERERAGESADAPATDSRPGDLFSPVSHDDTGWDDYGTDGYPGDEESLAAARGALSLSGSYPDPMHDMPEIPEIPDVGGDDLTPFDPFTATAEQTDYVEPVNGTPAAGTSRFEQVSEERSDEPDSETTMVDVPAAAEPERQAAGTGRSLFEPVVAADPLDEDSEAEQEPVGEPAEEPAERTMEFDTELVAPPEEPAGEQGEPVAEGPFGPGSALPRLDGGAPSPEFTIKARTSSMVFHTPGSPFFDRLLPQVWFRTPEDAKHAGFTSWERPQNT